MNRTTLFAGSVLTTLALAAYLTFGPDYRKKPTDPAVEEVEHDDRAPSVRAPEPAAPAPPSATGKDLPNVVLVFGCTVRKDQLPPYGGAAQMPWLDQFAQDGTVFEDALSVSSWTRASAVGVLTSRHPLSLNLPEPGPRQSERILTPEVDMLAELLQAQGYQTYGSTANPNLNAQYGMAQGMQHYRDSDDRAFRHGRRTGHTVVADALAQLEDRDPDKPVYLQLMLIDAHHPRKPPADLLRAHTRPGQPPILAEYQASLAQLDSALKALDDGLEAQGLTDDNTVFVFVADHGEGLDLPAHHGPGHGKKMYRTTVEIPWMVRGPGVEAGQRIDGLASGVDVLPTVLGLLDVAAPKEALGDDLSGWLAGEERAPLKRERAIAYSMFHRADVGSIWTSTRQCQQFFEHDRDHLVTGCFDRAEDPDFTTPIEEPELLSDLIRWRSEQLRIAEGKPVERTDVDADVAEQLRILGYAD